MDASGNCSCFLTRIGGFFSIGAVALGTRCERFRSKAALDRAAYLDRGNVCRTARTMQLRPVKNRFNGATPSSMPRRGIPRI